MKKSIFLLLAATTLSAGVFTKTYNKQEVFMENIEASCQLGPVEGAILGWIIGEGLSYLCGEVTGSGQVEYGTDWFPCEDFWADGAMRSGYECGWSANTKTLNCNVGDHKDTYGRVYPKEDK